MEARPAGERGRRRPAFVAVRGLAAGLAAVALVAPAAAIASKPSKPSKSTLLAEARAQMQRDNAASEKQHLIPFKRGTKFTIACTTVGQEIVCNEHSGPTRCVKGRPWIKLSASYPILDGKVGRSMEGVLLVTREYCPRH